MDMDVVDGHRRTERLLGLFPLPVVRRPYLDMQAFLRGSAGVRVQVRVCANEANRKPAVASVVELGQQQADKLQAPTRMS